MEIILNIDSDHLDYFKDIDHIVSSFEKFASLVPWDGYVIGYAANPFVNTIIRDLPCHVVTFGFDKSCDYYARHITFNAAGMPGFSIWKKGKKLGAVQLAVPGEHNIANALASFACCHILGVDAEVICETLENYTGTQRRFDIVGMTTGGVKVVDDYAHHPTEIKATLKAAQNLPHRDLWCIFQPHTYTRTMALFDDFANSFQDADKVILAEIYAAREKNIHKLSSRKLAERIQENHPDKEVYYFDNFEEIGQFVLSRAAQNDLVLTMGAGDIYKVGDLLMENGA
jgi:UDP-N-acetylmuramate--alanine ligase